MYQQGNAREIRMSGMVIGFYSRLSSAAQIFGLTWTFYITFSLALMNAIHSSELTKNIYSTWIG